MLKVSILIPVYNVEKYIQECIESILNQRNFSQDEIEMIFVDDCSTDSSASIIENYSKKYSNIQLYKLPENTGAPGKPRNLALEKAQGEYVLFMDPDDVLADDALSKFFTYPTENVDFVMSRLEGFYESDPDNKFLHNTYRQYAMQKYYINEVIENYQFLYQVKTSITTKLVKRDFLIENNITFIEGLRNGEDKIYDIKIYDNAKTFTFIPETTYYYRIREDEENKSLTQGESMESIINDLKALELIYQNTTKRGFVRDNCIKINVLRSVIWKMKSYEFLELEITVQYELFEKIRQFIGDLDQRFSESYLNYDSKLIDLILNGKYDIVRSYLIVIIEREQIIKAYNVYGATNRMIIGSRTWKYTKLIRVLGNLLKGEKKDATGKTI